MTTTIIEGVRNYILTCPYLDTLKKLNINFLDDGYSIEEVPVDPIIATYIDGSSERQFVFTFATRFEYNEEVRNNIENSGFFEKFEQWLEDNQDDGNLPDMPDRMTARQIEINSNGYLYGIDNNMAYARYQIQLKLLYDKE